MLEALCWIYLEHAISGLPARFYYYAFLLGCFFLPFLYFFLLPVDVTFSKLFSFCAQGDLLASHLVFTRIQFFGIFTIPGECCLCPDTNSYRYDDLIELLDTVFWSVCVFLYLWEKEKRLTAGAHWRRKRFLVRTKTCRALSLCPCVSHLNCFLPLQRHAVMCSAWLCWRIPHFWMMHSKFCFCFMFCIEERILKEMNQLIMSLGTEQVFNRQLPTTYLAWSIATCCYYLKDIL